MKRNLIFESFLVALFAGSYWASNSNSQLSSLNSVQKTVKQVREENSESAPLLEIAKLQLGEDYTYKIPEFNR